MHELARTKLRAQHKVHKAAILLPHVLQNETA
jgi:hypothetical protein